MIKYDKGEERGKSVTLGRRSLIEFNIGKGLCGSGDKKVLIEE